jgi:curved DNA-binding protein CbpA
MPDYYQILGVAPTASLAEITAAYQELVLKHSVANNGTTKIPADLLAAWKTLSSSDSRMQYDQNLAANNIHAHSDPYARQQDEFNPKADPIFNYKRGNGRFDRFPWEGLIIAPIFFSVAYYIGHKTSQPFKKTSNSSIVDSLGTHVSNDTLIHKKSDSESLTQ